MIKYYHQLRREEYLWLIAERNTYQEVAKSFPQPSWCSYKDAIQPFGCWSLTEFDSGSCRVTGKDFCKECDCYLGE